MIYLDYSSSTYVDKKIIKKLVENCKNCGANPNSMHDAGLKANELITKSTSNICKYLNILPSELIYTSGSSESNNTVIKGIVSSYGIKKIITTPIEHSSIIAPINYLSKDGVEVEFCKLNNGIVDTNIFKNIDEETPTLVSICMVDSELGFRQPIEEIALLLKDKKNVIFHTDITQAIGKINVDLTNVDLASFSGHKIYTFKGIGGLVKKENIKLTPLIHGGKSTSVFRSGTPCTELIGTLSDAFDLVIPAIDNNYRHVKELNDKIRVHLSKKENISINSSNLSIPHILNFSILGHNSDGIRDYFNKNGICISTKTACATNSDYSAAVKQITNDIEKASSSIRVSLSFKTKESEVNMFLKVLDKFLEEKVNGNN